MLFPCSCVGPPQATIPVRRTCSCMGPPQAAIPVREHPPAPAPPPPHLHRPRGSRRCFSLFFISPHSSLAFLPFLKHVSREALPAPLTGSALGCGAAAVEPAMTSTGRPRLSSQRLPQPPVPTPRQIHPIQSHRLTVSRLSSTHTASLCFGHLFTQPTAFCTRHDGDFKREPPSPGKGLFWGLGAACRHLNPVAQIHTGAVLPWVHMETTESFCSQKTKGLAGLFLHLVLEEETSSSFPRLLL